jgi:hypothetical protein
MGKMRNKNKILVGMCEREIKLSRHVHRWKDNFKMDLREIEFGGVDWINLAPNILLPSSSRFFS